MELKQGLQEALSLGQRRKSQPEPQNDPQSHLFGSFSTFWDHYACFQEPTDILTGEFNKNSTKNKTEDSSLVDYVDQFLWNRDVEEDSPLSHMCHHQPSSLIQREINIHTVQPSPCDGLNKQQKIAPQPLQPPLQAESLQLSKDYKKNLAGYIIKKVLRMLLAPSFRNQLHRLCRRADVEPSQLIGFLECSLPRVFGPNSIYQLFFTKNAAEKDMKKLLLGMLERALRKKYTLEILREGRMRDYEAYMGVKNKGLLYFSNLLR